MARRRTARRVPGDNVLPDQFKTVAAVLPSDWAEKHQSFMAPIRRQNGGDRLERVWQDIAPRGSSRRSSLFFAPYFPARLDFPSPPLSAPGSPRMT